MCSQYTTSHSGWRLVNEKARELFPPNVVTHSKYTILSFLPLNLYEQFLRPINLYFLIIAALQFIPHVAPVSPLTTLVPLLLAFGFSAAKEGIDDLRRHQQDAQYNARRYRILDRELKELKEVQSRELRVGDILWLQDGEEAPCDAVLLLNSDLEGMCRVSTENLDGENDPKIKYCALSATTLGIESDGEDIEVIDAVEALSAYCFSLLCEAPNSSMLKFSGVLSVERRTKGTARSQGRELECDMQHLTLASSVVRNSTFTALLVIYTGKETKVGLTKRYPQIKWARLDQTISRYAVIAFVVQFLLAVVFSLIGGLTPLSGNASWYVSKKTEGTAEVTLLLFLRYLLLLSVLIPISFKVMVDCGKYFMSLVISWDCSMTDSGGKGAMVYNTALAEDLGQVQFVLSDKTGTLTENRMTFHSIAVENEVFHFSNPAQWSNLYEDSAWEDALMVLTLCNSVYRVSQQSELNPGNIWTSPSPDEQSLLHGASLMGVTLLQRSRKKAVLLWGRAEKSFIIHTVIPFSSQRGMMSVLVESESGVVILLSKGADEKVLSRCASGLDKSVESGARRSAENFAKCGLRTMVLATRRLSKKEFAEWQQANFNVPTVPNEREATEQSCGALECQLIPCAVTAVEDHLQEMVPQSIEKLRDAGIRVWMLTGDKHETAEQVALRSGLLQPNMKTLRVHLTHDVSVSEAAKGLRDQLRFLHQTGSLHGRRPWADDKAPLLTDFNQCRADATTETNGSSNDELCLVVSGYALTVIEEQALLSEFTPLLFLAATAICYRVAPYQKAFVLRLLKSSGRIVLAIGDGGNDVAMIQEAHVGVGISGNEGLQAARAADFSIAKFSFLCRLLLVHGHTAYQRSAYLVQYCFYKSYVLGIPQLYYNLFAVFSGVTYWNSYSLTLYNGLYTVPLVLCYALDYHLSPMVLFEYPSLYALSQRSHYLNSSTFVRFVIRGAIHGAIAYFSFTALLEWNGGGDGVAKNGKSHGTDDAFVPTFSAVLLLQCFIVVVESHSMTFLHWLCLCTCILTYIISFGLYSAIPSLSFFGVFEFWASQPLFYIALLLVSALLMGSQAITSAVQFWYFPTVLQRTRAAFRRASQGHSMTTGSATLQRPLCLHLM